VPAAYLPAVYQPAAPGAPVPVSVAPPGSTTPGPTTPGPTAPVKIPSVPNPGACPTDGCDRISKLCCCSDGTCGWITADYVLWSVQSDRLPALVARDVPGTPRGAVGLPGTPGQQTLFGASGAAGEMRSGLFINGGLWLDECHKWAISGDFFFLGSGNSGGTFSSAGDPPLSRPFLNAATGTPDAELVSYPGVLAGGVTVGVRNTFVGAGGFIQYNLCCGGNPSDPCNPTSYRVDLLTGYRYYALNDFIQIQENLVANGQAGVPIGTAITVTDRFHTENSFQGGLIGLSSGVQCGKWLFDFRGGVDLGDMHRESIIEGTTVVQLPGQPPTVRVGGLLAQPSNIGRYTSDTFTAVPEFGMNVGYQLTKGVSVHVGYTFVFLPNVWRAGDQIDHSVDPIQLTGAASPLGRPAPIFASTSAVVQGINFGVKVRY
jgi:hypothetical protein